MTQALVPARSGIPSNRWQSCPHSHWRGRYLKATLEAIANGHPQARIDDLLPWNFQPSS